MEMAASDPKLWGGHTECTLKLLGHTRFPHPPYRVTSPKCPCVGCCWAWHLASALGFHLWRSAEVVCVSSLLGNSCFLGTFPVPEMLYKGMAIHMVTTKNWINGGRGWNHLPKSLSCRCLSFIGVCGFWTSVQFRAKHCAWVQNSSLVCFSWNPDNERMVRNGTPTPRVDQRGI